MGLLCSDVDRWIRFVAGLLDPLDTAVADPPAGWTMGLGMWFSQSELLPIPLGPGPNPEPLPPPLLLDGVEMFDEAALTLPPPPPLPLLPPELGGRVPWLWRMPSGVMYTWGSTSCSMRNSTKSSSM